MNNETIRRIEKMINVRTKNSSHVQWRLIDEIKQLEEKNSTPKRLEKLTKLKDQLAREKQSHFQMLEDRDELLKLVK
ncbi:MAG: hypothetical protein Unbinned97contig1000_30 [Prokaryotic dsDNA virus sp.]|nr:MAG: hypothetical protein Unbinned97contig1000_30 [Prokaryotic dsDNA virus sp.]